MIDSDLARDHYLTLAKKPDPPALGGLTVPAKDELENLAKTETIKSLCEYYQVTYYTIKKWLTMHKIERKR